MTRQATYGMTIVTIVFHGAKVAIFIETKVDAINCVVLTPNWIIKKLAEADVDILLQSKAGAQPLGALATTSENKPWETPVAPTIDKRDFAAKLTIVKANMLYFPIGALSAKIINHFKRIASFRNPEFYSRQAMRLTT